MNGQALNDGEVKVGTFTTEEPSAFEQALAPLDVMVSPRTSRPFGLSMTYLASPGLVLFRDLHASRIRMQGVSPPGRLTIAIPLRLGNDSSWFDAPLHEKGMPATLPGGLQTEYSTGQLHLVHDGESPDAISQAARGFAW